MFEFIKQQKVWIISVVAVLAVAVLTRTVGLMQTAPSLYWEEVALGYDAYSIAQTGKDHHGNAWPLVAFESFGDWKPSLYFYAVVPFVKVFGLAPWAVRAPSVLSGLAIVVAVGWLAYLVAKRLGSTTAHWAGMVGLLVATFSPWATQFARAGWEVNLATALVSWGMVFGLQVVDLVEKKKKVELRFSFVKAISSVVLLVLAVYSYHGTRVVAPLLGLLLAVDWWWQLKDGGAKAKQVLTWLAVLGLVAVAMMVPVLISLRSPQVTQRFAETSIFSQLDIIVESNEAKTTAGNSWLSSMLYHRYLLFGREIMLNYFDHFNLNYLVVSGDVNPRHSTQYGGILLYPDLIFLAIGALFLIARKNRVGAVIIGWWLISIVPAALTTATPHALRTLPGMPAVATLIALGIFTAITWLVAGIKQHLTSAWQQKVGRGLLGLALAGLYMGSWTIWWHHYLHVYPKQTSAEWQYGYEQMVTEVNRLADQHPELPVYITREQGRPAMYYWFFSKADPTKVQAANATASKDQGEFLTFENITFPSTVSEVKQVPAIVASSASGKEQLVQQGYTVSDEWVVKDLMGKPVWVLYLVAKK